MAVPLALPADGFVSSCGGTILTPKLESHRAPCGTHHGFRRLLRMHVESDDCVPRSLHLRIRSTEAGPVLFSWQPLVVEEAFGLGRLRP